MILIGQMASNTPEVLEFPQVARSLEQQLLFIVVRCLTESVASQIPRSASRHEAIVARLEAYIWRPTPTGHCTWSKFARLWARRKDPSARHAKTILEWDQFDTSLCGECT